MLTRKEKGIVGIVSVGVLVVTILCFWWRKNITHSKSGNSDKSPNNINTRTKDQSEQYDDDWYSFYKGYTGLVNPASMLYYNAVNLRAQRVGCNDCTTASNICMKNS